MNWVELSCRARFDFVDGGGERLNRQGSRVLCYPQTTVLGAHMSARLVSAPAARQEQRKDGGPRQLARPPGGPTQLPLLEKGPQACGHLPSLICEREGAKGSWGARQDFSFDISSRVIHSVIFPPQPGNMIDMQEKSQRTGTFARHEKRKTRKKRMQEKNKEIKK